MLTQFKYIGASFKKANLSLREAISLNERESKELISEIKDFCGCNEILIISTCNRTGFYYNFDQDISEDILKLWGIKKGIHDILSKKDSFVSITNYTQSIEYLFRVSMGLESQVVGDIQISNQFKHAYQRSADLDACGPFLHRLMHSVFFTNKRVVQETSYRDGTASVSYAAVELMNDFAANFKQPKILIVGLGEIGVDVARNLKDTTYRVTLCNRTDQTATQLAQELDFESLPFNSLKEGVFNNDIILSAAQVDKPIIDTSFFDDDTQFALKYMIDLSVPRSIDPEIAKIAGTLVYNIDNIKSQTEETILKRKLAIPSVEKIISEAINDLNDWGQEMEVSPTINKLKNALEDIRKEEIARHLKSIDESQLESIENITKGMMQKIIKLPVMQLKAACKRGEAETLIDVLNNIFNLEKEETVK